MEKVMIFYTFSTILSIIFFILCFFIVLKVEWFEFIHTPIGKVIILLLLYCCYFIGGKIIKRMVPNENTLLCSILFGGIPTILVALYAVWLMLLGWYKEESFFFSFVIWIVSLFPLILIVYAGVYL